VKRLLRLCNSIQAMSPYGSLSLTGVPSENPDRMLWKGTVSIGCVILLESTGSVEEVIKDITMRLERMSQQMMKQLVPSSPPEEDPPSNPKT
jgi:hypothetical protein